MINHKEITAFLGKGRTNWIQISKHQTLSEDFIRRHAEFLEWNYILEFQILTDEFLEEMKHYIETRGRKKTFKIRL